MKKLRIMWSRVGMLRMSEYVLDSFTFYVLRVMWYMDVVFVLHVGRPRALVFECTHGWSRVCFPTEDHTCDYPMAVLLKKLFYSTHPYLV